MISRVDDFVGKIVAELKHLFLYDCTILVFIADLLQADPPNWKDDAIVEYFGPGVEEPWFVLRRGTWKNVWCRNSPAMLFDLAADPEEQTDLAGNPTQAPRMQAMHDALFDDIDIEALTASVIRNKKQRIFLDRAMQGSEGYLWDDTPDFDGSKQFGRCISKPATA